MVKFAKRMMVESAKRTLPNLYQIISFANNKFRFGGGTKTKCKTIWSKLQLSFKKKEVGAVIASICITACFTQIYYLADVLFLGAGI